MWASGLVIAYGLYNKERLRARLAAAGSVWTAQEDAARQLMATELEETQQQVAGMSDHQLADLAVKLMTVSLCTICS